MKLISKNIAAIFLSGALVFTSCEAVQNANDTQKGVAIGTAAGAILGGILGNNVGKGGNGTAGAVLGGIVGGVAGGVIGNKMDKQAKEIKTVLPGAEVERVGEGIKVVMNENSINFNFDSAELTSVAKANLDKITTVFKTNPDTYINVYGHTDSRGSVEYNNRLSVRRADAVAAYLIAKGIERSRLTSIGMGPSEPIDTNDTDAGRARNRRVELTIKANEKMIEEAKKGQ